MKKNPCGNYMIVGNLQEVMQNKIKRQNYIFTYEPSGLAYYVVDGLKTSPEEFNGLFPIDFKPIQEKGKNSDKRKNWMHGDRAY